MIKCKKFIRYTAFLTFLCLLPCNQTHAEQLSESIQSEERADTSETISDTDDAENTLITEDETTNENLQSEASQAAEVLEKKEQAAEEISIDQASLIDVYCPTNYPFLVYENPADERRLTSQIFYIANKGLTDVTVDLSDVQLIPKEGLEFHELSDPIDSSYQSDTKDIFAFLKVVDITPDSPITEESFQNIDIPLETVVPEPNDYILTGTKKPADYTITLKAANHDKNGQFESFNTESVFAFYISGTVTPNKNLVWNHGDLRIQFNINFNSVK